MLIIADRGPIRVASYPPSFTSSVDDLLIDSFVLRVRFEFLAVTVVDPPENVDSGEGASERAFASGGTVVVRIDPGRTVTFDIDPSFGSSRRSDGRHPT